MKIPNRPATSMANSAEQRSNYDTDNIIVHVPKHMVAFKIYKKEHKYVPNSELPADKKSEYGIIDKCLSVFRPKTPSGMRRVINKQLVGTWELTLYEKQRRSVSISIISL